MPEPFSNGEEPCRKVRGAATGQRSGRPQAVMLVVLGLLASGLLFLWLGGTDLFDGRSERVDLANAILFAAAVMTILSASLILVGWFIERAERRQYFSGLGQCSGIVP